ncbi:hypothetical protein [Nonomuraea jiangxiensis]|uniref:ABC-2 family transporter protein n=1 Tax=Nonomuraea jiangxiensis TaxID=633440 RepID=A0A1G9UGW1_9ACTN|nr:hypothetical protein [Nonomuraea jiangxiensis]SDM59004.1 hypothetical protein SAMN05421869_14842 [Nonomuraea jiangxiensis]
MTTTLGPVSTTIHRVTLLRVARSELVKFLSLRLNLLTLAAAAVVTFAFGLVNALVVTNPQAKEALEGSFDPVALSLAGPALGQLVVSTLGVMVITGEYASGSIRGTLAAVPQRLPVLWAKIAVVAVASFVTTLPALLASFLISQPIFAGVDLPSATLDDPGVRRAVIASALYLTGTAIMGVGLGLLFRNTAAAAATLSGVLLIGDSLLALAPPAIYEAVAPFLPSNAGLSFTSVLPPDGMLPVWGGVAVFAAYLVVISAGAALALRRRDV